MNLRIGSSRADSLNFFTRKLNNGRLEVVLDCLSGRLGLPALEISASYSSPKATLMYSFYALKSTKILSMRRSGSAAPQSSWSPTVKAVTYSGPKFIL